MTTEEVQEITGFSTPESDIGSKEWLSASLGRLADLSGAVKDNLDWLFEKIAYPQSETGKPREDVLERVASGELENLSAVLSRSGFETAAGWRRLTGPRGSNEGGWYESTGGERAYLKFYEDEDRARIEYIACQIYQALGVPVPKVSLQEIGGRLAIASEEIPGSRNVDASEMASREDVISGFIADAYLGNRDVTGSIFDNIIRGADGMYYRVDNGGSLIYRARGGIKDFPAEEIVELDTMRNPKYPAGVVFSGVPEDQLRAQAKHLIETLTTQLIDDIVDSAGLKDPRRVELIKAALRGRREYLQIRFGLGDQEGDKTSHEMDLEKLNLESIRNPEILEQWVSPVIETVCGASFKADREIELRSNQAILIKLPDHIKERILDVISIHHRKAEQYRGSVGKDGWDSEGAYTRVLVWDKESARWVGWKKGVSSDKFAENRPEEKPEVENLNDWLHYAGRINPEYLLIIGAGKGENGVVSFQGVDIETFASDTRSKMEMIFSPGTRFVKMEAGETLPSYGGGERPNMGIYPGSIPLNNPDTGQIRFKLTKNGSGFNLEQDRFGRTGSVHIPITAPISMERVELAVGDTQDLNGVVYKRDETFRRGWAKMSAVLRREDGSIIRLMHRINVPPRGILKGSPEQKLQLQPGDEIIITSEDDAAYLMGVRLI